MQRKKLLSCIMLLFCLAVTYLSFNATAVITDHLPSNIVAKEKHFAFFPSLTGQKAVEYLQSNGEYQSLQKALRSVQKSKLGVVDVAAANSFQQNAYIKASNTDSSDNFGVSIAISGDTLVIGATRESSNATGVNGNQKDNSLDFSGAAYVFVRTRTGWAQQAYIKASNPAMNDNFGASVAIDGNTIVIGAPNKNSRASTAGAVYVFVRNGSDWSQQAYLVPTFTDPTDPNDSAAAQFGRSVAISGDTMVIGAPGEHFNHVFFVGAAYVFTRTGSQWNEQAFLRSSAPVYRQSFGRSVAISGDTLAIGSNGITVPQNGSGGLDILFRSGSSWSRQAYLTATNTEANDSFGFSVALEGNTLVVGAIGEASSAAGVNGDSTNNDKSSAGAAYVFERSGTAWNQQAYLKASNPDSGDNFGSSVAISGDKVVVGAQGEGSYATGINGNQSDNSALYAGAAYLFTRTGASWQQDAYIKASNTDTFDRFGISSAITPDALMVGASTEDGASKDINGDQNDRSAPGSGAVYAFVSQTDPLPTCAGLVQEAESGLLFGSFVSTNDASASNGQYIQVPNGSGDSYNGPVLAQRADYCFDVSTAGTYWIKAKTLAADVLDDSFFVRVDDQPANAYLWDVEISTGYQTNYVNDRGKADPVAVQLSAGQHIVSIYLREDGTRLDTLELEPANSSLTPTCAGLIQEAESGAVTGNWVVGNDDAASGGSFLHAIEGSGNFWNGANPRQQASYCFNVDTTGLYRIRGKVYGADTLSDSFYVSIDGQPTFGYLWDILSNTTYASDFVSDRDVADPIELELGAGQHIVNVFVREDGARLDTIELQLVRSGPPPTPVCAGLVQEAENGAVIGNFVIGNDEAASGGAYIHTPSGSGDFWNGPNPNHKAEYCFDVDSAGSYRIDGNVYGADNLSDSFYVNVDGQPANGYLWDVLPNTAYQLDSVSDRNQADPVLVTLSSGQHTVTVYARESGTRLDTIQLVPTTPSAQSRAIPPLAAGIDGTVRLNVANLSSEIDFSQFMVTLLDAETNGAGFSQQVQADRFGNYHFDGMLPGNYLVQIQTPIGMVAETSEITITATMDEPVNVDFAVNGESAGSKTYLPLLKR